MGWIQNNRAISTNLLPFFRSPVPQGHHFVKISRQQWKESSRKFTIHLLRILLESISPVSVKVAEASGIIISHLYSDLHCFYHGPRDLILSTSSYSHCRAEGARARIFCGSWQPFLQGSLRPSHEGGYPSTFSAAAQQERYNLLCVSSSVTGPVEFWGALPLKFKRNSLGIVSKKSCWEFLAFLLFVL